MLTDGLVSSASAGTIVEEVKLTDLALTVMGFAFHENLSDERRDGAHRSRNSEKPYRRETGIRQPRVDTLTDGPNLLLAGQSIQRL